jgi:TonB family protein
MAYRRKAPKISKLSATMSLLLHAVLIGGMIFFAAREGMLGKQLKKIAVTMVPKEKRPEKLKEKPPEKPAEKPPEIKKEEPAREEPQKLAPVPPPEPRVANTASPPPTVPTVAPPAAAIPSFDFEGGKMVESSSDPKILYKGFVEYTFRSAWKRPEGVSDANYAAEVEIAIDPAGHITGSQWKKGSGHAVWDNSVRQVVAQTKSVGRPPPKGFPDQVLVRFDVQAETDALMP